RARGERPAVGRGRVATHLQALAAGRPEAAATRHQACPRNPSMAAQGDAGGWLERNDQLFPQAAVLMSGTADARLIIVTPVYEDVEACGLLFAEIAAKL